MCLRVCAHMVFYLSRDICITSSPDKGSNSKKTERRRNRLLIRRSYFYILILITTVRTKKRLAVSAPELSVMVT